jgi:hypothetical protein
MSTLKVEILNPKAAKLLKNLADLKLIAIDEIPENGFSKVLTRFRAGKKKISLEEITTEVESVRAQRHGR